jgi:hypothetical protein
MTASRSAFALVPELELVAERLGWVHISLTERRGRLLHVRTFLDGHPGESPVSGLVVSKTPRRRLPGG